MRNARILYAPSLPHRVAEVWNKKQKLHNDILDFLKAGISVRASFKSRWNVYNMSCEYNMVYWRPPSCSYWSSWGTVKEDIELLALSLSCYASYHTDQNKKVRNLHFSCHPIQPVSENLSFQFLPQCHVVDPLLHELDSELSKKEEYNFFVFEDLCPAEPRRKYEYLKRLKSRGLSESVALLTYSHGNNIGNIHFVWKV